MSGILDKTLLYLFYWEFVTHLKEMEHKTKKENRMPKVTSTIKQMWKNAHMLPPHYFYCLTNMHRIQTRFSYSMSCLCLHVYGVRWHLDWLLGNHSARPRTRQKELLNSITKAISDKWFYIYVLSCSDRSCFLKCPWYSSAYLQILCL